MNAAAETVLGYAGRGLAVLPLHTAPVGRCTCRSPNCRALPDGTILGSPGKHPLLRHGAKDASSDPDVVAEWLARWPGCNWGGCPPENVIVVDVDPRNGGDHALDELEATHGQLPPTLTARTGSGGWHVWLVYKGSARGKLGSGLDIKKAGGYVVLPPSVHATGGAYRWTDTRRAAPAPQWLRHLLNPPLPAPREPIDVPSAARDAGYHRWLDNFVREAPEGTRNHNLFRAACLALERGFDLEFLRAAAAQAGLEPAEIKSACLSAQRRVGAQSERVS